MLRQTSKETNILKARLKRIVTCGENLHEIIDERKIKPIELYEDIPMHCKLRIKDKNPPCTITLRYEGGKRAQRNLDFYWSTDHKEPGEGTCMGH